MQSPQFTCIFLLISEYEHNNILMIGFGVFFFSFHLSVQFSQQFSQQKYPYVLKAGHCHGGTATARIETQSTLQDAAGLLSGTGTADSNGYCTLEPYIDAKFDIHVQKIGVNYKAFM